MEQQVKTAARIPKGLHAWLRAYARDNSRTMNEQLIAILRERMKRHPLSQG